LHRVLARDVIDPDTGEIVIKQGKVISEENLSFFKNRKNFQFDLIQSLGYVFQPIIAITLAQDRCFFRRKCLERIAI